MIKAIFISIAVILICLVLVIMVSAIYINQHPNRTTNNATSISESVSPYQTRYNQQTCYQDLGCTNFVKTYCQNNGGYVESGMVTFYNKTYNCKFSNGKICDAFSYYKGVCTY